MKKILALLLACAMLLTCGVLFAACTEDAPEENGDVIARFLASHKNFTLLRERTLTPDVDGTDGFYFAVLEKNADA